MTPGQGTSRLQAVTAVRLVLHLANEAIAASPPLEAARDEQVIDKEQEEKMSDHLTWEKGRGCRRRATSGMASAASPVSLLGLSVPFIVSCGSGADIERCPCRCEICAQSCSYPASAHSITHGVQRRTLRFTARHFRAALWHRGHNMSRTPHQAD